MRKVYLNHKARKDSFQFRIAKYHLPSTDMDRGYCRRPYQNIFFDVINLMCTANVMNKLSIHIALCVLRPGTLLRRYVPSTVNVIRQRNLMFDVQIAFNIPTVFNKPFVLGKPLNENFCKQA